MCPQACLNVCKRSCNWRLFTRQELWARSEDRIILMWLDFFSPLYIPTIWFFFFLFWCNFERTLSTSPCVTSIAQGRMRELENRKSGDFSGQTLTSCSWGHRGLCLTWGSALGLLLLCSSRRNCYQLRQLYLNMHLNFLLSLSPWYTCLCFSSTLWHPWAEKHTVVLYRIPLACA